MSKLKVVESEKKKGIICPEITMGFLLPSKVNGGKPTPMIIKFDCLGEECHKFPTCGKVEESDVLEKGGDNNG